MAEPLALLIDRIATPIGELIVIADREGQAAHASTGPTTRRA